MNVEALEERYRDRLLARRRPSADSATNRASEMGHPCTRYLVLVRTEGHKRAPVSPELQAIFADGEMHEEAVKRDLHEMGLPIYGAQASFPKNSYEISGHIDGDVEKPPSWLGGEGFVIEVKSLNQSDWDKIQRSDDRIAALRGHRWIRKWYCQGQIYCLLKDRAGVLFVLKNKATGWPLYVFCPTDLAYLEGVLERAQIVNDHVRDKTLPPFHSDVAECKRCSFFRVACDPPMDFGREGYVETEIETVGMFEDWQKLDADVGKKVRELALLRKRCAEHVRLRLGQEEPGFLFAGSVVAKTKLVPVKGSDKPRPERVDCRVTLTSVANDGDDEDDEP